MKREREVSLVHGYINRMRHLTFTVRVEGEITENPHYEPLSIKNLVDPSMSNWCHHSPYVLKQGRIVWWSPEKEEEIADVS